MTGGKINIDIEVSNSQTTDWKIYVKMCIFNHQLYKLYNCIV